MRKMAQIFHTNVEGKKTNKRTNDERDKREKVNKETNFSGQHIYTTLK